MRIPDTVKWWNDNEMVDLKDDKEYAAVAIVLCKNSLVIEKRSSTREDPWSGQFSLPGGHYSKEDSILRETAIRETLEETGIDLKRNAKYLGHFGPFVPRNRLNLEVHTYVFEIPEPVQLVPSGETEYLLWVQLSDLHKFDEENEKSFKINEGIVWGLTARIIQKFLELSDIDTK